MNIIVTLNPSTTSPGPFNIYYDVVGDLYLLAKNVSTSQLISGFNLTNVPDNASTILVQNENPGCKGNVVSYSLPTTTTTSTTTTTTTAAPTTTTSTTTSTTTLGPNLYIVNNSNYSYTNFVAAVSGSNVSGITAVSLPNSGFTISGTTTSFVLGTNSLVLYSSPTSGSAPISVFSITDYVTSAAISFTQQQNPSNANETDISITGLLQSNITNGIRVQLQ